MPPALSRKIRGRRPSAISGHSVSSQSLVTCQLWQLPPIQAELSICLTTVFAPDDVIFIWAIGKALLR